MVGQKYLYWGGVEAEDVISERTGERSRRIYLFLPLLMFFISSVFFFLVPRRANTPKPTRTHTQKAERVRRQPKPTLLSHRIGTFPSHWVALRAFLSRL